MDLSYQDLMHRIVQLFELVGVAILLIGSTISFVSYARQLITGVPRRTAFVELRATLGRGILLGLEVLVIADIVRTIVVEPTLRSTIGLGVIVLVRIALSFAIDVEIDGIAPWRKRNRPDGGDTAAAS